MDTEIVVAECPDITAEQATADAALAARLDSAGVPDTDLVRGVLRHVSAMADFGDFAGIGEAMAAAAVAAVAAGRHAARGKKGKASTRYAEIVASVRRHEAQAPGAKRTEAIYYDVAKEHGVSPRTVARAVAAHGEQRRRGVTK